MCHDGDLKWYRWESRTVVNARGNLQVSRKMLLSKRGNITQLITEFEKEVKFLAEHLFRADWQHHQFRLQRNIKPHPAESVCMVLDFAENFSCTYQEEVQAAHWHHDQVTVHPSVTYYRCPSEGCQETVTESLVFISNDLKHDFNAVHLFNIMALAHLRNVRGLTVTSITQWTDGCASQYKSKGPFADIACSLGDLNATMERHYFGSRHSKGPSDGESAVVKNAAATAVVAGRVVIATAENLFEFLIDSPLNKQPPAEGCSHSLRTFFWVGEGDIQRQRNDRAVLTVPGTRSFHNVKCVERGTIMSRHLSCSCDACQTGVGACQQAAIIGDWSSQSLRAPGQHRRQRQPAQARQRQPAQARQRQPVQLQHQQPAQHQCQPVQACQRQPAQARQRQPAQARQRQPVQQHQKPAQPQQPVQQHHQQQPAQPQHQQRAQQHHQSGQRPNRSLRPRQLHLPDPISCPSNPPSPSNVSPALMTQMADDTRMSPQFEDSPQAPLHANIPSPSFSPETSPSSESVLTAAEMLPTIISTTGLISASTPPLENIPSSVENSPTALPSSAETTPEHSAHGSAQQVLLPALTLGQHPSADENQSDTGGIKCGSWVKKSYTNKRGQPETFCGQVISFDEATRQGTVKFLKRTGKYYVFPDVDDLDFVDENELTLIQQEPTMDARCHYFFKD